MSAGSAPLGEEAPDWPSLIARLLASHDLPSDDVAWAMGQVMEGNAPPVQLAGFLVALRAKGETVAEMRALAEVMLRHAVRIDVPGPTVDVVGTGGDRLHTVNISTMAALVVAGAGVRVVKHGNRAASSSTGTADVLEELGVRLDLPPERVRDLAAEVGITFCFAQAFHPSMRHAGVVRSGLGVPTAFNFLGPLTNPAQPAASALGVADARMAPLMAGVIADRGHSALVFRGEDGLDELSIGAPSRVWVVTGGAVAEQRIDPAELGLPPASVAELRGGDARRNAQVVRDLLAGAPGPVRDAVVLNAAAALTAAELAYGPAAADLAAGAPVAADEAAGSLPERLRAGMARAAEAIDSGAAAAVLERWVKAAQA